MRVLVCADRLGALAPWEAGASIARAFVAAGNGRTQVAVVPLASAFGDLSDALDRLGQAVEPVTAPTPSGLARRLLHHSEAGGERPALIDLTPFAHAGPDALGDFVEAFGVPRPQIPAPIGVIDPGETDALAFGLHGVAARHLYMVGAHPREVVRADARLQGLTSAWGIEDEPGLGASGGLGLALAALGGRVATGVDLCADAAGLDASVARADLVVVVTDTVTTGNFGGPALLALAGRCPGASVPLLAIARQVDIAGRELREHGVESAAALGTDAEASSAQVQAAAASIAHSWTW